METHTPSLGDQIARLRGTAQAQEKCAWIPAAIHVLIIAALMRIFGRLEQIFLLWQSGDLPAPQIRAPRAPRPRAPRSRATRSRATPRPTGHRARTRARQASVPITPAPRRPPEFAPFNSAKPPSCPRLCPHQARAPPPTARKNPRNQQHQAMTILLRYNNKQRHPSRG